MEKNPDLHRPLLTPKWLCLVYHILPELEGIRYYRWRLRWFLAGTHNLCQQVCGSNVCGFVGGGKGSTEVLAGTCLVSSTFLDGLQQRCAEYARDAAEQSLKDGKQAGATASTSAATNANGCPSSFSFDTMFNSQPSDKSTHPLQASSLKPSRFASLPSSL